MEVMFCTISTKYRLYQCIAMYNSLKKFLPNATLAVLCMDEDTKRVLEKAELPGMRLIPLSLLESKAYRAVKVDRSVGEYCWTMKPVLLQYLLSNYNNFEVITYLDSDLYFFDNPIKLFAGNRNWNVMVTTHKVNRRVNSGFIALRRNKVASKMVEWWRKKCLNWCYDRNEKERFGDQGYLDSIRKIFHGIKYLKMPGVNIAPWNCFNYDFSTKGGRIYVGRCRLIFFHFSGFRLRRIGVSSFAYESDIPCEICSVYRRVIMDAIEYVKSIDNEIVENFYLGM